MSARNRLYSDLSKLYLHLSKDRDFDAEVDALGVPDRASARYCELFAGPAYHSLALMRRGWAGQAWAVDNSAEMRAIALDEGFAPADHYLQMDATAALRRLYDEGVQFDVISAMRYSLGLVEPAAFHEMMGLCGALLAPGGRLMVESHRMDLLTDDLADMDIRTRRFQDEAGRWVTCVWPSGPLEWDRENWRVTMPIDLDDGAGTRRTWSVEHIYARRELEREAALAGLRPVGLDETVRAQFPQSVVTCFEQPAS